MFVTWRENAMSLEYDNMRRNKAAAIHARAEQNTTRTLVTTETWAKVCLMARNRSPLIKTKRRHQFPGGNNEGESKCQINVTKIFNL